MWFIAIFFSKGNSCECNGEEIGGPSDQLNTEGDASDPFSVALHEMFSMETIDPNSDPTEYPDTLNDAEFDEEFESDFPFD